MLHYLSNTADSGNDSLWNDNRQWNANQLRFADWQRAAEEDELSRAIAVAAELEELRRKAASQTKQVPSSSPSPFLSSSSISQEPANASQNTPAISIDLSKPSVHDAYRELGLPLGASMEDIKTAYRHLMMRYHPDRAGHNLSDNPINAERAQRINQAYSLLQREWSV